MASAVPEASWTSAAMTRAPSAASRKAYSRPRPVAAPVTTARCPSSCRLIVFPPQIRVGNAAFFGQIQGIHHTVVHEWVVGSDTIVELEVSYDRLDGVSVTIPVVSIWTRDRQGLFSSYRVFFDLTPVFS